MVVCVQTSNEILSVIQSGCGSPVITNRQFFDDFIIRNASLGSTYQKRRFKGRRINFWCTLSLGLDAESFYVRLNDHIKLKGLGVNFFVISILPFFDPSNICTEYRVCGLLELDKEVRTSCPHYFSPTGFNIVYEGLDDHDHSQPLLSHHVTTAILTNQLHADRPGWFYTTPGWLSREQTSQLMWAGAVSFHIRFMFELVGLKLTWLGRFVDVHASQTQLTSEQFDLLYAFLVFRKDLEAKLDLWLLQDNSLSKSPSFDDNQKVITSLLKKKREFEAIEFGLFELKEYVPKHCISWVL